MLVFRHIRYMNFLSTGNTFTEVDLSQNKTTLIVGQNGSGKSTILDAISFALFGKPHRNINKPQLVNSINQKACIVEVEFEVNGKKFKVVRGIKPVIFEIWVDGTLMNQNSHNKEYQKILEQNILKLNHKSFHQVVVLGSSSFIPFMQLTSHVRREVIEDLLDINVFSKMNALLKERLAITKDKIRETSHSTTLVETKLQSQNKYITDITKLNEEYKLERKNQVDDICSEVTTLRNRNDELVLMIGDKETKLKKNLTTAKEKQRKLSMFEAEFKNKIKMVVKDAKFYEETEQCPTCEQSISHEIREDKLTSNKKKAIELTEGIKKVNTSIADIEGEIEALEFQTQCLRDWNSELFINNQTILRLQQSISVIQSETNTDRTLDLEKALEDQQLLNKELDELRELKYTLNDQYSYSLVVAELLKDTGFKTKIIKQYLPVINKLVNAYLQVLDFFVSFDLDESFNETIRSRHRDIFTYASFSEGEKQRIDLALLFTWRQIAKMKNSISTNLLILDETFDSSLDQDGIENLMKIIHTLDNDTNIFIISHKGDMLEGKFENKIEFYKEKNFSRIK